MKIAKKEKIKTYALCLRPSEMRFLKKVAKENKISVSEVVRQLVASATQKGE